MARQRGLIQVKGAVDNLTFTETKDGYLVQKKSNLDSTRIANDPRFELTRQNGAEFGTAAKAGSLLRAALKPMTKFSADRRMVSRMTKVMSQIVKSDPINGRGKRTVQDGNMELLLNFEFNGSAVLKSVFEPAFTVSIDRVAGQYKIDVPAFVATTEVNAPIGTTHFKIVTAGIEIDFARAMQKASLQSTEAIPWTNAQHEAISVTGGLTPNGTLPICVVLGVQFYQLVAGNMERLKDQSLTALKIVDVDLKTAV